MKALFLSLIIILSALTAKQPDHIIIRHIGISDKPIFDISIYDENTGDLIPNRSMVILHHKDYIALKSIIQTFKNGDKPDADYGCFDINITEAGKATDIYLNRKTALSLFSKLLDGITKEHIDDQSLLNRLLTTQKRIDF